MTQKAIELKIGEVRGNREFLGYFGFNEKGRQLVKVKCLDCGAEKVVTKYTFTRNVGCRECKQKEINEMLRNISTKHGLAKNKGHRPLYDIYMGIISRCNNPKNHAYGNYGGRGIKCEWNNVEEFVRDMGEGYKKGLSIDRIDVNGNYCKENCRWATYEEQNYNKGITNFVEIDGIKYNGKMLAERCKIPKSIANDRISKYLHGRLKYSNLILEGCHRKDPLEVLIDGKTYRSKDIGDITGINPRNARKRLRDYIDGEITKEKLFAPKSRGI